MTWVAVAIGGSALIGAGASYAGSKKQAKGAEKAAQMNMDMFNIINRQQAPYVQSGYGALGSLNTLLGLGARPGAAPAMSSPSFAMNGAGGMQPRMQAGGPGGDPYMNSGGSAPGGALAIGDILRLRAQHGDTQAASMMRRMALQ